MKKKKAIIITIGEKGIIITTHNTKNIENKIFFEEFDDEVKKSLNKILEKKKTHDISIILDTLDQSYKKKSFPSMKKNDLKILIKREINSDVDKESMKNHIILDQITNQGKTANWQVLFISTSIPKNAKTFLEYINQLPNRLIGIYLAPIESTILVNLADKDSNKDPKEEQINGSQITCLVSQTKVSGMRQTIFHKNQILFTRLLDYSCSDPDFIKRYEKDLYASFEYLKRIFPEASISRFKIINILSKKTIDLISKMRNIEFNIDNHTPFTIAKLINKNFQISESAKNCDLVLSESLFRERKQNLRFSTNEIDKMRNIYLFMKFSYFANLLILLAIGILSVSSISKISKSEEMINIVKIKQLDALRELTTSKRRLETRENELKKKFQDKNINADKIISIGQISELFEKNQANPLKEYVKLKFLKKFNVKLNSIEYSLINFKEENPNSEKYKLTIYGEMVNKNGDIDELFSKYDELKSELTKQYKNYKFTINELPKNINLDKKYHSFKVKIAISSK